MKERKQAVIGIQVEGKVSFTFLFQFSNKDMVIFLFLFFPYIYVLRPAGGAREDQERYAICF